MTDTVMIETGVPVPTTTNGRTKYPYREMDLNDSFLVTGMDLQVICNGNYRAGKRLGRKFIARKVGEGEIRVWRVA